MGLKELVEISREYGADPDYVLAGGGNTSFKDARTLWVKASGVPLATIDEGGFVALSREKLAVVGTRAYDPDPAKREDEVKRDLLAARSDPASALRPSVEASLHDLIAHPYVVHTHPHLVNAMLCGRDGAAVAQRLFGAEAVYVPYTDPGYTLYLRVKAELGARAASPPPLIFLENHGVFVGGATPEAVRETYRRLMAELRAELRPVPAAARSAPPAAAAEVLPALRMILSGDALKVGAFLASPLAEHFTRSADAFADVASAFTPDQIVYCRAHALYVEAADAAGAPAEVIAAFQGALARFTAAHGHPPRIVGLRSLGVVAFEDSAASAEIALAVFEDAMKIAAEAASFGGPRFLTPEAIAFIDGWEVEHYRRAVSTGARTGAYLAQRIAIVTGGAQGFGAGIVEHLHADGVNVVVADLNEEKGRAMVAALQAKPTRNRARFVKADVGDPASVEALVRETVLAFGGLDVFISNAGILRAGSLEEMDPRTFELMTRVNYTGYFHGAKYASRPMKLQHAHRPGHLSDIIQINSKSGLEGSNKNFAYAGGKFGGIGLTQSFALELMEHGVKVNSICPGNFFDGPLWSDPEAGLFVQYLRSGKVPGAKTVADVKRFYEAKVPARRGCTVLDVVRAIRYVIEQEYETGQAVPVTGGQVMLR
jgi:rhamnose utilization protein RhaD (predicted bifunctional aldolase and dehydrogenase)/NAD(P)-dependent dehydrogenase (short-subunit alcohol dehydrogenase family)